MFQNIQKHKNMQLPKPIEEFVKLFSSFPSIGQRQATRLAFYLINKKEKIKNLLEVSEKLEKEISVCNECFMPFYNPKGEKKLCPICSDKRRNKQIICVVEKETDLLSIESSKQFSGVYHILGGSISVVNPNSYKKLRIKSLLEKIRKNKVKEIIIATNPTASGDLTAMFIERKLKELNIKVTRLGRGLPTGGEIEFADPETLSSAFKRREETK